MALFKRLFGSASTGSEARGSSKATETYKGFTIIPEPIREGAQWRLAARIEREIGGEVKRHHLVRADMLASAEEAATAAVGKARLVIDQQGDGVFD